MATRARGLFWAPLVPAGIIFAWALIQADAETAGMVFLPIAAMGYFVEIVVALPLLIWVSRRGSDGLLSTLAIGAFSPVPVLAVISTLVPLTREGTRFEGLLNSVVFAAPLGLVAAFAYWFLAQRKPKQGNSTNLTTSSMERSQP